MGYQYQYDERNRCIKKKLPGTEWIRYVYDKADRLILSQDGEQRIDNENKWLFSIPDIFGRPVLSGLCMASVTNDKFKDKVVTAEFSNNATQEGYIIANFDGINISKVLTVNYYDNYDFLKRSDISKLDLAYDNSKETPDSKQYTLSHKGRLTGSAVATESTEGDSKMLYTAMYYDDRGQVIQSQSTNHLGGKEQEYIAYSFTGQPKYREHVHIAQGKDKQSERYTYSYDHGGRLVKTSHKLNNNPRIILAENKYDQLGRLESATAAANDALKSSYSYNIRSWTEAIRNKHFEQTLAYGHSGNIKSMEWTQADKTRKYDFIYDPLSRLTNANYTGDGNFTSSYAYDVHGNITEMIRNGAMPQGTINGMRLEYAGNQLQKITNDAPKILKSGFPHFFSYKTSEDQPYAYNANGAMTTDPDKGVEISYNSLNLPLEVVINNTSAKARNLYTYTATGTKLRVKSLSDPTLKNVPMVGTSQSGNEIDQKTMDYVGNMIYENGKLKMILTDNGYYDYGSVDKKYYFYIKDHLGNNRVVADADGSLIQSTQYYPFGLAYGDGMGSDKQPFKYNGKELDSDHGLNMYDYSARYYEPAVGRFTTVDPLAEKYYSISPYAYVTNNPINAVDPDGKLVIFINGFHQGNEGGKKSYWGKDGVFATMVMQHLKDSRAKFFDGSLGGPIGLPMSLQPENRFNAGYVKGKNNAKVLIESLKGNETIKIITHSMGGAFGKGFLKALIEYLKEQDIDPSSVMSYEADFAPFQPNSQEAIDGVKTYQYSHSEDNVAGNKKIKGAEYKDTSSDKDQNHSINSFTEQIKTLPSGTYTVTNGVIKSK